MFRSAAVALLFGFVLVSCTSSEDEGEAARKRCLSLRDHLIDLRLAAANQQIDVKAHRAALQQALGDKFVEECAHRPVQETKCALAAADTASAVTCSQ